MTNEERVTLVFETLSKIVGFEVKPDKPFYIVANGKKSKYKIKEDLSLYLAGNYVGVWLSSSVLPIFKGGYQFEEIKEPLLTEEEKELLKKFDFETVKLIFNGGAKILILYTESGNKLLDFNIGYCNLSFNKLEPNRTYTAEELEL